MKLNLGCCDRYISGFIGVDLFPAPEGISPELYQQADLAGPWPWPESSVDEVVALDVCEHIGDMPVQYDPTAPGTIHVSHARGPLRHVIGRIHFMNELHRVLKPGARATIETPNAARGVGFFQDPTHVSPWCLSTFKYFEAGKFAHSRLSGPYGITAAFRVWKLYEIESNGEDGREKVWKIHAELEAVK